jgi:hypothetical protein
MVPGAPRRKRKPSLKLERRFHPLAIYLRPLGRLTGQGGYAGRGIGVFTDDTPVRSCQTWI